MSWDTFNKAQAEQYFNAIKQDENLKIDMPSFYTSLRIELKKAYEQSKSEIENIDDESRKKYTLDCLFALKVYNIFKDQYLIKEREASKDQIWRYIQLVVVPEIIKDRWGWNEDRFYKLGNRIYLKILWWYIFLSWNEDEEKTKQIILNPVNSSDTIAQLVERVGYNGYRVELYRTIMKKKVENRIGQDEFRKLMTLNTARVRVINPYLLPNGVEEYVDGLIKEIRSM